MNTAIDSDDGNPVLRNKARAALSGWRSRIADLVRSGQQNGELRKTIDPDSVATVMIAALEGAVMIGGLEKTRQPLHVVGKHLEKYLLSLRASSKS
jgi:TetR/AcrR family transcriptional repressor of nem operon